MTRHVKHCGVNLPYAIGDVSPKGDAVVAALAVQQRIAEKGEQLVMVAPSGSVYVMPSDDLRASVLTQMNAAWIAGVFTGRARLRDIAADLVTTFDEQQGLAP